MLFRTKPSTISVFYHGDFAKTTCFCRKPIKIACHRRKNYHCIINGDAQRGTDLAKGSSILYHRMKSLRIIYMGTPAFAISPLLQILETKHKVMAVITAPDRKSGRGKKLTPSPIKVFCEEHDLPILQPPNLKDPDLITQLRELAPDVMVVVAFRMLPKEVWSIPPNGTFNLHASLLPKYRGAAPILGRLSMGNNKQVSLHFLSTSKSIRVKSSHKNHCPSA